MSSLTPDGSDVVVSWGKSGEVAASVGAVSRLRVDTGNETRAERQAQELVGKSKKSSVDYTKEPRKRVSWKKISESPPSDVEAINKRLCRGTDPGQHA